MTVSKEWLDMALSAWTVEAERDTTGYGGEVLAALTELASRRAADEGAVTVETPIEESDGGDKFIVVGLPDEFGEEGDDVCSVTIRRRP